MARLPFRRPLAHAQLFFSCTRRRPSGEPAAVYVCLDRQPDAHACGFVLRSASRSRPLTHAWCFFLYDAPGGRLDEGESPGANKKAGRNFRPASIDQITSRRRGCPLTGRTRSGRRSRSRANASCGGDGYSDASRDSCGAGNGDGCNRRDGHGDCDSVHGDAGRVLCHSGSGSVPRAPPVRAQPRPPNCRMQFPVPKIQ